MYCHKCGTVLPSGAKFYEKCGAPVLDDPASPIKQSIPVTEVTKYKGLGGWLILVALGMAYDLFITGSSIYTDFNVLNLPNYSSLSDPTSSFYIGGYSIALTIEIILEIALFIGLLYLFFLFFRERRVFPKYFIFFLVGIIIYAGFEAIIPSFLTFSSDALRQQVMPYFADAPTNLLRAIIFAGIWIPYMKKSSRVRATFINQ